MNILFSCRNCVQNCAQGLNLGKGVGYCLQHDSIIHDSEDTTCKYLHRKDLPSFVVEESAEEHRREFWEFPYLVSMTAKRSLRPEWYSEKVGWERRDFDSLIFLSSQYHRAPRAWVLIQSLSGRVDGRISLLHASMLRRYTSNCGSWKSSYKLILGLIQELDATPSFSQADLVVREGDVISEVNTQATWEVFFTRLGAIQEYGWHSGIEELRWASDHLGDALIAFDWSALLPELSKRREDWMSSVIAHAKENGQFFAEPKRDSAPDGDNDDERR